MIILRIGGIIGKRKIEYTNKEFSPQNQTIHKINEVPVAFPANWEKLVIEAKDRLLAEYYPIQSIELNSENEVSAIKLLKSTTEILDQLNIPYWLEGGTLLGAVRDQKLIPWDHDLDIGVKYENDDTLKKLISQLRKKYYIRALPFSNEENVWSLGKYRIIKVYPRKYLFFREKLCLDIFIFYRDVLKSSNKEVYKYGIWNKNAYYDHKLLEELSTISFYGREYSTPGKTSEYLEAKYGDDWKIPRENWNVVIDDKSISRQEDQS